MQHFTQSHRASRWMSWDSPWVCLVSKAFQQHQMDLHGALQETGASIVTSFSHQSRPFVFTDEEATALFRFLLHLPLLGLMPHSQKAHTFSPKIYLWNLIHSPWGPFTILSSWFQFNSPGNNPTAALRLACTASWLDRPG